MAILPVGNMSRMPGGRVGRRLHELVEDPYAGVVKAAGVKTAAGMAAGVKAADVKAADVKAAAGIVGRLERRRRGSCGAAGNFDMVEEVAVSV